MQHDITLSEEALIFLAEMTALQYAVLTQKRLLYGSENPVVQQLDNEMEKSLRESLRETLREPLKNKSFRLFVVNHFETHPLPPIREISWPRMSEWLTWEE